MFTDLFLSLSFSLFVDIAFLQHCYDSDTSLLLLFLPALEASFHVAIDNFAPTLSYRYCNFPSNSLC